MARRPNGSVDKPKTAAERKEEARKALTLKVAGLSDHQIATELQVSVGRLGALYAKAVQELGAQPAETLRAVEEVHLDLLRGGFGRIFSDATESADNRMKAGIALLRISESRRRLLGLDLDQKAVTEALVRRALESGRS